MSKQWHPLFARLLTILIEDYYEVQTEVPVSDLPRRGDLWLIRRQGTATPHFQGLWSHLTDWNVVEFKGPTDDAEVDDLELLAHVGMGLTYRQNEKRQPDEPRVANRQVSFWYLAPKLGDTFLSHARTLMHLEYETGGLWRGSVWGHRVWLLAYEDAPVEEDTIPLYLLGDEAKTPKELGTLVLNQQDLLLRYADWFNALQPSLFKEIRQMAETMSGGPRLNWKAIGETTDLLLVLDAIPPEEIIKRLGVNRILEAVEQRKGFDAKETEDLFKGLMANFTPEQILEMVRQAKKA